MNITITPAPLRGTISLPPSKSETLRLSLCAALYGMGTDITYTAPCDDIRHMEACLSALADPAPLFDCGDSAAVLRFLLPVAAALGKQATFQLSPGLARRPHAPLIELLSRHGAAITNEGQRITVRGQLTTGHYAVPTGETSQYLSGLFMALPLVGGCTLSCTSPLPSAGYADMTRQALSLFGVLWQEENGVFSISEYAPRPCGTITPEGDFSAAALWICLNALPGNHIEMTGLSEKSLQPDRAVMSLTAKILREGGTLDMTQTPDLLPILAVLSVMAPKPVTFTGAARLRGKESDRLSGTAELINALGGNALADWDALTIHPTGGYAGGTVSAQNDHRLAMGATLAACMSRAPVTIMGAECVSKSYPSLFSDFASVGGVLQREE